MRILGIDPGTRVTGYGCVDVTPGQFEPRLVEAGVLKLDAKASLGLRLRQLHGDLASLMEELKPQCMVVEKLYAHYKHPRTAILMAHARGVFLLSAAEAGIELVNLPSTEVKKSITGNGHASKQQVQLAVQTQFGLDEPPSPPDVADAIAIATCHARRLAVEMM